ncbi:MAG: DinB family protein [Pseudomonadota bacterium]
MKRSWAINMARYNAWQNRSLYSAADTLSDEARRADKGAFFGSLHNTLAHILWADRVWLHRFNQTPPVSPTTDQGQSPDYANWEQLKLDRIAFDQTIQNWANELNEDWLNSDFTWSNIAGTRTATRPAWQLVTHLFNHQTHHRGQAHALLTAAGAKPEDTDFFFMEMV